MAKPNFSNYRLTPRLVIRGAAKGHRVADEDLLEVIERSRLPIGRTGHAALRRLLGPKSVRRGRPSANLMSKTALISRLQRLRRPDLPPEFINLVIDRLERATRYTRADSDRAYARRWRIPDRNMILRGIYDEVYDQLASDPSSIDHAILGSIKVPTEIRRTRSDKALQITHDLLRDRTVVLPPSLGTMMRIISEDPVRKRRPRT